MNPDNYIPPEPLCGKEWLEAHQNDHRGFKPTIEVSDGSFRVIYQEDKEVYREEEGAE